MCHQKLTVLMYMHDMEDTLAVISRLDLDSISKLSRAICDTEAAFDLDIYVVSCQPTLHTSVQWSFKNKVTNTLMPRTLF